MSSIAQERSWVLFRDADLLQALQFAERSVHHCRGCREAAKLAVSELAENLIKYGRTGADRHAGRIGIAVADTALRVTSTNDVADARDANAVLAIVKRLSTASAATLYRERLGELFKDPVAPRARLGMLRVAFEGGFNISCQYAAPLLTLVAERTCKSPPKPGGSS